MAKKKNNAVAAVGNTAGKKKWWNKKKVIAISIIGVALLAAIIFAAVVIATTTFPISSSSEESRVVGHFEGYEVKYEELRYVVLINKKELDVSFGKYETLSDSDKEEYEALLREAVLEDIKSNYAVLLLCDKYGIDTGSIVARFETQNRIQEFVNESFEGNVSEYKKWLKDNGLTDSFLRFTFRVEYFEEKLYEYFLENKINIEYDNTDFDGFIDYVVEGEDWVRTIHAYFPKEWQYATDSYDAESKAEKAYNSIISAEGNEARYAAMKKAIGSAPIIAGYSIVNLDGIYFTYGQMGEEYESAAFALEEYGVSQVVETVDGYYVIMRLPVERDYVDANAIALLEQYRYGALKIAIDEKMEEMSFKGNSYFDSLSLIDVK